MDARVIRAITARPVLLLCCMAAVCLAQEKGRAPRRTPEWAEKLVSKEQLEAAAKHGIPVAFEDSIGMKSVLVPPGAFMMGSNDSTDGAAPIHRTRITKPFYMGVTEVTQAQWKAVMGSAPWGGQRYAGKSPDAAASYVSWNDATEFCKRLSQKAAKTVRLPTEAEWEYACRAGSKTKYCFGDDEGGLGEYAWYVVNAKDARRDYAQEVAQKKPNAWGLYDMHGNVWEWCTDWYADYPGGDASDPTGPSKGGSRVMRGGHWRSRARYLHSAFRFNYVPTRSNRSTGLRVVTLSR